MTALLWSTWRHIRQLDPDIIHAHWIIPQGLVLALLKSISRAFPPFIVTSHGVDLFALNSFPFQSLKRFTVRQSSGITVVSKGMAESVIELGATGNKVMVQSMGTDMDSQFIPDNQRERTQNTLLFVGRLVEKKGLRQLIEAMPLVLARRPQACLNIVGFGPDEKMLRSRVKELQLDDHIHFKGPAEQRELPTLYQEAAVFIAPFMQSQDGDMEGFGLVILEAAGCLCPVVIGDVPATRDSFGDLTELVDARDSDKLSEKITAILDDPAKAQTGVVQLREQLKKRYSWENVAPRYSRFLQSAARGEAV